MRICDHLNLSLLTCVHSFNLYKTRPLAGINYDGRTVLFYTITEEKADEFLSDAYYWLNKKVIRVNQHETIVTFYRDFSPKSFTSTLDKIKSIARAIFCFLPGIFLKMCFWILNYPYILERNRKILSHLKKEQNRSNQEISSYLTHNKGFETPRLHQTGPLFRVSSDLTKIFVSYLKNEDLMPLMLSSKQTYEIIANYCSSSEYLSREYHPIMVNAIGIELLKNIPCSTLPKAWDKIIADTNKIYNKIDLNKYFGWYDIYKLTPDQEDFAKLLFRCPDSYNFIHHGCPIQKIQLPEGPALAFQIKNNRKIEDNIFQFVLAITSNGLKVYTKEISENPGFWGLLNGMRYHPNQDCPQLQDYLTRLFNEKACGKIILGSQPLLNFNHRVSGTLTEGPRYCDDDVTPVIQLWPPISIPVLQREEPLQG